jgi:hypothetical protein
MSFLKVNLNAYREITVNFNSYNLKIMKVLFISQTNNAKEIYRLLQNLGITIITNKVDNFEGDKSQVFNIEQLRRLQINVFNYIDFILFDGVFVKSDISIIYFIIMAMVYKKRIINLYTKGTVPDEVFRDLSFQSNTRSYFKIYYYSKKNISNKLEQISKEIFNDIHHNPEVKYTLRMPKNLYKLLMVRSKICKKTISKLIREILAQEVL